MALGAIKTIEEEPVSIQDYSILYKSKYANHIATALAELHKSLMLSASASNGGSSLE
jgi:hypothetical protein